MNTAHREAEYRRGEAMKEASRSWTALEAAYLDREGNEPTVAACIGRHRLAMENLAQANVELRNKVAS